MENKKSHVHKKKTNICDSFDLDHAYRQSVGKVKWSKTCTSALFPRRDNCPQLIQLGLRRRAISNFKFVQNYLQFLSPEERRRLHNEKLNDLYSSPNIVRVTKSRRMRWAGHVARMGEERGAYGVLVG